MRDGTVSENSMGLYDVIARKDGQVTGMIRNLEFRVAASKLEELMFLTDRPEVKT